MADAVIPGSVRPMDVDIANWRDANEDTKLHLAAREGAADLVRFLIVTKRVDVNAINDLGQTALHVAAASMDLVEGNRRLEVIKALLENGADPYSRDSENDTFLHRYFFQDEDNLPSPSQLHSLTAYLIEKKHAALFDIPDGWFGMTPLQLAVRYMEPQEETLVLLDSKRVNFNSVNEDGDSVLGVACYAGRSRKFVSKLMKRFGADPKHRNHKRESILHIAAQLKNAELLKFLLESGLKGLAVNEKDSNGRTPLHVAVHPENQPGCNLEVIIEKCKLLLNFGANVNLKASKQGTPLHLASIGKDKAIGLSLIELLAQKGANLQSQHDGATFLHHYIVENPPTPSEFHSLVEYLVNNNHSRLFNIRGGEEGFTPLHAVIIHLEPEERTLLLLQSNGVNFNILDKDGDSVLVYAIQGNRSLKLLSFLINKMNVNWTEEGCNLLHFAAEYGSLESLKFLIELGGLDINQVDDDGDTPLHCLMDQDNMEGALEKCQLLITKGASVTKLNKKIETPLDKLKLREWDENVKHDMTHLLINARMKKKGGPSSKDKMGAGTGNKKA